MLGHGDYNLASGAALLLMINVVSVNLSSKIVFFIKGIRPRTWVKKKKANHSMIIYILAWLVSLMVLALAVFLR